MKNIQNDQIFSLKIRFDASRQWLYYSVRKGENISSMALVGTARFFMES
jgi:hypothetical protein